MDTTMTKYNNLFINSSIPILHANGPQFIITIPVQGHTDGLVQDCSNSSALALATRRHRQIGWPSATNVLYTSSWYTGLCCCDIISSLNADQCVFLAATKQLYKWYFLSVCLSHLFDYVSIIISSWNFQELLPMTKLRSLQKVKVRCQRSRSQRSQPNLTVSGL